MQIYSMEGKQGWARGQSGRFLQTFDHGKSWSAVAPDGIQKSDTFVGARFPNDVDGYAFYLRSSAEQPQLLVFRRLQDGGGNITGWASTPLPTTASWETSPDVTPLAYWYNIRERYVLLMSGPALGQMSKSLYRSDDSGASWQRIGDLTASVPGYPTGFAFRRAETGWMTAAGRDPDVVPLYRTQDAGKTWKLQPVAVPNDLKGGAITVYQPQFDGENDNHGLFLAAFMVNGSNVYVAYESYDSGETWKPQPYRLDGVQSPPVLYFDDLIEGRALSTDGSTLYTMVTYNREDWQKHTLPAPLGKVDQLYLRDDGIGWVLRNGEVLITSDGGTNWSKP